MSDISCNSVCKLYFFICDFLFVCALTAFAWRRKSFTYLTIFCISVFIACIDPRSASRVY